MRHPLLESVLSTALVCALAASAAPAPATPASKSPTKTLKAVPNFTTVTDQALRAPRPSDWLMYRGNYQGWGYSPLEQINKTNVKTLQLAWSRAMGPGPNEMTPIVHDGIMYLGNPSDVIQAIDAATGDLIWEYKHPLPPEEMFQNDQGQKKRGIVVYGNHVFFVTWNNMVVSLDARTGEHVWQSDRGGDVLRAEFERSDRRQRHGHRGQHLQRLWQAATSPVTTRETARAVAQRDDPASRAAGRRNLGGRAVREALDTGVWGFITYDPDLDLVFYGSSGVGPASEVQRERSAGRWPAPTRAGPSIPRPARSSGGIRSCRATIGTRNARSR